MRFTSWKTTLAGVGAILGLLGPAVAAQFDGNPATDANWSTVGPTIIGMLGLLFARDHNVTSEQAGAK